MSKLSDMFRHRRRWLKGKGAEVRYSLKDAVLGIYQTGI